MKHANRYEQELKTWSEKEQRLAGLFSPSVLKSKAFAEEKLRHYERLLRQPRVSSSLEERLTRRMILQEKKGIERKLYPNLVLRVVRRAAVRAAAAMKQYWEQQRKDNRFQNVRTPSDEEGSKEIRQLIRQSRAVLIRPVQKPEISELSAAQQQRLSEGHVVHHGGKWLQYDFNDQGANGNYKVLSARLPEQGLQEQLKNLPLSRSLDVSAVLEAMKRGESPSIHVQGKNKEVVLTPSINVRLGKLDLLDEKGAKVSLGSLREKPVETNKRQKTVQQAQTSKTSRKGIAWS